MTPNNLAGIIIVGTMVALIIYAYVRLCLWNRRTFKRR